MKTSNVNKIKKVLKLEREIIGVKFIHYKEQYDENEVKEYGLRTTKDLTSNLQKKIFFVIMERMHLD